MCSAENSTWSSKAAPGCTRLFWEGRTPKVLPAYKFHPPPEISRSSFEFASIFPPRSVQSHSVMLQIIQRAGNPVLNDMMPTVRSSYAYRCSLLDFRASIPGRDAAYRKLPCRCAHPCHFRRSPLRWHMRDKENHLTIDTMHLPCTRHDNPPDSRLRLGGVC